MFFHVFFSKACVCIPLLALSVLGLLYHVSSICKGASHLSLLCHLSFVHHFQEVIILFLLFLLLIFSSLLHFLNLSLSLLLILEQFFFPFWSNNQTSPNVGPLVSSSATLANGTACCRAIYIRTFSKWLFPEAAFPFQLLCAGPSLSAPWTCGNLTYRIHMVLLSSSQSSTNAWDPITSEQAPLYYLYLSQPHLALSTTADSALRNRNFEEQSVLYWVFWSIFLQQLSA